MGIPLMLLSLWMLFVPKSPFAVQRWQFFGGEAVSNLYLFVWISALYLSFTLVDLPYRAWGAELSPDYNERSQVTGWREAFGYGGTLMALLIPLFMSLVLDMPGANNALFGIAIAVVVLLPVLSAPALLWVPELPSRSKAKQERVPWRRGLKIVWANGPYRRLVISLLFLVAAVSMTASLSFFFVGSVMEEPFDRYAIFMLAYYLSSSLAIPAWFAISRRHGETQNRGHRHLVAVFVECVYSLVGARPLLAVFCDYDVKRFRRWCPGFSARFHGCRRSGSGYAAHGGTTNWLVFLFVGHGEQSGSCTRRSARNQWCRLVWL